MRDSMTAQTPETRAVAVEDATFDLSVELLEVADPAGLVNITNDNCGSTCGACTTGVA